MAICQGINTDDLKFSLTFIILLWYTNKIINTQKVLNVRYISVV
ncbi:MAG: hypothetical protein ABH886_08410 [Candidatus Desantisbacteria bacterium]